MDSFHNMGKLFGESVIGGSNIWSGMGLNELCQVTIDNLEKCIVIAGRSKLKYEGGLLSGFRLTSILGSIINLSELAVAQEELKL